MEQYKSLKIKTIWILKRAVDSLIYGINNNFCSILALFLGNSLDDD